MSDSLLRDLWNAVFNRRALRVSAMVRDFVRAGGLASEHPAACPDCGSPRRDHVTHKEVPRA